MLLEVAVDRIQEVLVVLEVLVVVELVVVLLQLQDLFLPVVEAEVVETDLA